MSSVGMGQARGEEATSQWRRRHCFPHNYIKEKPEKKEEIPIIPSSPLTIIRPVDVAMLEKSGFGLPGEVAREAKREACQTFPALIGRRPLKLRPAERGPVHLHHPQEYIGFFLLPARLTLLQKGPGCDVIRSV